MVYAFEAISGFCSEENRSLTDGKEHVYQCQCCVPIWAAACLSVYVVVGGDGEMMFALLPPGTWTGEVGSVSRRLDF